MKSDYSRITFDPRKHFSSVRMQQGRVQIDADSNEQIDIVNHRVDTEAGDVIGLCGAPLHYPAFHIVKDVADLSTEEKKLKEENKLPPDGFKVPFALPDFLISAGRYYVDGILCENEKITSYLNQQDLPDATAIKDMGLYVIYVDVWERLLTALDDQAIREIALGGPDTATRAKTVWQVKYWLAVDAGGNKINVGNCATTFDVFDKLVAPSDGQLSARSKRAQDSTDPCIVPPGSGYTGLENQLYRVEIHDGGAALDETTRGELATRVPNKSDQIEVSGSWDAGQAIEIFSSTDGADSTNGTLAYIVNAEAEATTKARAGKTAKTERSRTTKAEAGKKILTLNVDVSKIALDELRVREAKATFKWSRDNGVVVTTIQSIDGQKVTVHDLGPDDALGFKEGHWVEISDDGLELKGQPGQLAQIIKIDSAINLITLNVAASLPHGVQPDRHPKLRRWDGVGAVKFHPNVSEDHFLDLESGVQVRFFAGSFRTGDYWTTAARTATADTQSGNIDWPLDADRQPVPQLPFGIKHHYCRLAMLHWDGTSFDVIQDCRNLFPPLTELTSLFYVSGDGQEVMPEPSQSPPILPQQLIVGVANGELAVQNAEVRFHVTLGNGQINGASGTFHQVDSKTLDVLTDEHGLASCTWQLDSTTQSQQLKASLQAVADLNDVADHPVHLPVIFTANLSVASQVAYNPGDCQPLHEDKTVQKALDRLSHLISLYEVNGNNQEIVPGETLQPLVVLAANRCGAVTDQTLQVHFKIVSGAGKVNGQDEVDVLTDANGLATCVWAPGSTAPNQEVEASLVGDSSHAVAAPTKVRFTSTLSLASHVFYDPSKCPGLSADKVVNVQDAIDHLCAVHQGGCCDVTVGKGGQFERLDDAIEKLLGEKQTDICICLLPGDHLLRDGLNIEGHGLHVKIVGCGRGSRILIPLSSTGTQFRASGLASFILRDVEIFGQNFFIGFDRCDDITFASCYLTQENQVAAFITIAQAKRIQFEDNVVSATLPMTQNPVSPTRVFESIDPRVSELFKPTDRFAFDRSSSEIASGLATLSAAKRKSFVGQLEQSLRGLENLTTGEVGSYNHLMEALAAELVDESQIRASLADIRLAALRAIPGTAIVFMDAEADTGIEDNDITGVVSLYGVPGKSSLTLDEMKKISDGLKKGTVSISNSLANLQVRDNAISHLDVSEQMTVLLKGVAARVAPGTSTTIDRLYRRCFITDNAFGGGNNDFVMEHLALTSNSFDVEVKADAGLVIANAAIYMGNYAPNDIRLFNLARTNQKAANLVINIVDV